MDRCDNQSVGVIVKNAGEYLLLERAKFPWGLAPPAGHIDDHGSEIDTAVAEVFEEVGIQLSLNSLVKVIDRRRIENHCRRPGGNYHNWTVFMAESENKETTASIDETNGLIWATAIDLQKLAENTRNTAPNQINQNSKILEKVWLDFFVELEIIQ